MSDWNVNQAFKDNNSLWSNIFLVFSFTVWDSILWCILIPQQQRIELVSWIQSTECMLLTQNRTMEESSSEVPLCTDLLISVIWVWLWQNMWLKQDCLLEHLSTLTENLKLQKAECLKEMETWKIGKIHPALYWKNISLFFKSHLMLW